MQTKSSYRVLKWTLFVGTAASMATACVVSSGDGTGGIGFGGEGGTTAGTKPTSGGSSTAGTKTTGGGGSTSTAGTMAMIGGAGAGGAVFEVGLCQADNPTPSLQPSCAPDAAKDKDNPCQVCMKNKCCTAWKECFGSEPTTACFHGAKAKDQGQFDCIHFCFIDGAMTATDPNKLLADCGAMCANQCDTPDNGLIMDTTSALVDCANKNCVNDCFPFN
jgi:hypothetical protein